MLTDVFCLTSKTSVNWRGDFLALGFFTVADGPGNILML